MQKVLLSFLLLVSCVHNVLSQKYNTAKDTISVHIYFRQGHSTLDASYRDNGANLDSFISSLKRFQNDRSYKIENIRVLAGASPEGNSAINKDLSNKRAEQVRSYFNERVSFDGNIFHVESVGVDWQGLTRLVEDSDMPYRAQVLDILRNTPEWITRDGVVVDGRKRQLSMLAGGKAWWYMDTHLFPKLRSTSVRAFCEIVYIGSEEKPEPEEEEVVSLPEVNPEVETEIITEVEKLPEVIETESPAENPHAPKPFYMVLKTNLLYDVALVPNIGAEFYLGNGWSLGANWMYAWWKNDKHHNYWRIYGGGLDIRKYFGKAADKKPLTGHHLGLYSHMVTYDFELGGTGFLSNLSYGGGVEYGYLLPVGRRLNLDFGAGVGYLGGEYKKYIPDQNCYVWQSTHKRHWFGPTKAEISLVWLIGKGNYNDK